MSRSVKMHTYLMLSEAKRYPRKQRHLWVWILRTSMTALPHASLPPSKSSESSKTRIKKKVYVCPPSKTCIPRNCDREVKREAMSQCGQELRTVASLYFFLFPCAQIQPHWPMRFSCPFQMAFQTWRAVTFITHRRHIFVIARRPWIRMRIAHTAQTSYRVPGLNFKSPRLKVKSTGDEQTLDGVLASCLLLHRVTGDHT